MPADPGQPTCPECNLRLVTDRETGEWVCIYCGRAWKSSPGGAVESLVTEKLSKIPVSERRLTVRRVAERFGQEKADVILRDDPELKEREDLRLLREVAEQFGSEKVDEILQDNPSLKQKWDEFSAGSPAGPVGSVDYEEYDEQPSSAPGPSGLWYLCPLLFGIIGGIIAYIAVRDRNKGMANSCLILGFVMVLLEVFVFFPLLLLELYR